MNSTAEDREFSEGDDTSTTDFRHVIVSYRRQDAGNGFYALLGSGLGRMVDHRAEIGMKTVDEIVVVCMHYKTTGSAGAERPAPTIQGEYVTWRTEEIRGKDKSSSR